VAPERWHLSYAPLALGCEPRLSERLLLACWEDCPADEEALLLAEEIKAQLAVIMATYVAVTAGWCPAHYPA
jgi:hypothetical protein